MSRKALLRAVGVVFISAAAVLSLLGLEYSRFINAPSTGPVDFTVGKGWGLARVAEELEKSRAISSAAWFRVMAKIHKPDFVKVGEYHLRSGITPPEIMQMLTKGQVVQHRLSFPEGLTVKEMVQIMEKADLPGAKDMLQQKDLLQKLAIDAPSLEGWLFPDTYNFTKGDNALDLIRRMVKRSQSILEQEWEGRKPDYKLSKYETLILASIIEKETGLARERSTISGVFHNRLKKKMKLQKSMG